MASLGMVVPAPQAEYLWLVYQLPGRALSESRCTQVFLRSSVHVTPPPLQPCISQNKSQDQPKIKVRGGRLHILTVGFQSHIAKGIHGEAKMIANIFIVSAAQRVMNG